MLAAPHTDLQLNSYLSRIGFAGELRPDVPTLRALHFAHATHIPFENLDVLLEHPISLDLPDIEAKLVNRRRGGYCFEQNALFAAVLEHIGFPVTRLAARVRLGTTRVLPRTHMLLKVEADGASWIADVGFGGWGLLEPIPLASGAEVPQGDWTFRLIREGEQWVLQCLQCPVGPDQYAFTMDPFLPVDYEPANHYCSTYPQSRFMQTLTAQLPSLNERVILRNRELLVVTPKESRSCILESEAALLKVLADRFGLHFPEGTSFGPTRN